MLINLVIVFGVTALILFIINKATTDAQHYKRIESATRWSIAVTFCALSLYCMALDAESGIIDLWLDVTYP